MRLSPVWESRVTAGSARSAAALPGPIAEETSASPEASARARAPSSGKRRNTRRRRRGAPAQCSANAVSSTRPGRALASRKGPVPTGSVAPRPLQAARALQGEEGLGEGREEGGVRPVERDLDDVGPHALGAPGEGPLAAQVLEVADHGVGVEGGAVVEPHPLPQGEGPDPLVGARPGRGEDALGAERARADPDQRLAHVRHDLGRHDVGRLVRLDAGGVGQGADDQGVGGHGREQRGEEERGAHGRILPATRSAGPRWGRGWPPCGRGTSRRRSRPRRRRRRRSGSSWW